MNETPNRAPHILLHRGLFTLWEWRNKRMIENLVRQDELLIAESNICEDTMLRYTMHYETLNNTWGTTLCELTYAKAQCICIVFHTNNVVFYRGNEIQDIHAFFKWVQVLSYWCIMHLLVVITIHNALTVILMHKHWLSSWCIMHWSKNWLLPNQNCKLCRWPTENIWNNKQINS